MLASSSMRCLHERDVWIPAHAGFIVKASKNIDLTADMKLPGKTVSRRSIGSRKVA